MFKILVYLVLFMWVLVVGLFNILIKLIITGVDFEDCEKILGKSIVTLGLDSSKIDFYAKQYKNENN